MGETAQTKDQASEIETRHLPRLVEIDFRAVDGLVGEECVGALPAFQRQASEILSRGSGFSRPVAFGGDRQDWLDVCTAALAARNAETFFAENFRCFHVVEGPGQQGLFTGYFEPEVEGSLVQGADYPVPVYRKPPDLVSLTPEEQQQTGLKYGRQQNGKAIPYHLRKDIENGALSGQNLEICWLKSWVDAFFMHIQGSGRVRLPDGSVLRLSYAAKSGLPYTGVGGVLADRGVMTRQTMSMQSVKAWMNAHPEEARQLMWMNASYVFFRPITVSDPALGAVGAAQVNLTPLRSMAVDRSLWQFGTPMWIETHYPPEAEKPSPGLKRLMIAQDTGSAIRGAVRGDFYWGWGDEAALIAGHMKSPGRMTALLPHKVAARLGL